jgi:hypothetical protein
MRRSTPLVTVSLALAILVGVAWPLLAQETEEPALPPLLVDENCSSPSGLDSVSSSDKTPEILLPPIEMNWTSANPCFVSCPSGGFIDCSWSWAGDPKYCCWKTSTRCMSYECNTGAIKLSKQCL